MGSLQEVAEEQIGGVEDILMDILHVQRGLRQYKATFSPPTSGLRFLRKPTREGFQRRQEHDLVCNSGVFALDPTCSVAIPLIESENYLLSTLQLLKSIRTRTNAGDICDELVNDVHQELERLEHWKEGEWIKQAEGRYEHTARPDVVYTGECHIEASMP